MPALEGFSDLSMNSRRQKSHVLRAKSCQTSRVEEPETVRSCHQDAFPSKVAENSTDYLSDGTYGIGQILLTGGHEEAFLEL